MFSSRILVLAINQQSSTFFHKNGTSVLDWTENSPDLNVTGNQKIIKASLRIIDRLLFHEKDEILRSSHIIESLKNKRGAIFLI